MDSRKGEESRAPRIPSSVPNFENHVTVAVNSALGDLVNNTLEYPEVNACVELRLNLILECEPGGNWTVSQAQLTQPNAQVPQKPNPQTSKVLKHPSGPVPPIKKLWRPKASPVVTPSPLLESNGAVDVDSTLETSSVLVSPSALTTIIPSEVNVASSSKSLTPEPSTDTWAMLLCEGKRLFVLPMSLMPPIPLSTNPFFTLSSENLGLESAWSEKSVEFWADECAHTTSTLLDLSDLEVGGVLEEDGSWDNDAMWVEPLAVSYPVVEEGVEQVVQADDSGDHELLATLKGQQSEWVLEQLKEFGLILGASFNGFEDKIMELLINIEASSSSESKEGALHSRKGDKSRVPRELRNLISGVNYAGGSSGRNSTTSVRALMVIQ
jgi:hypothetical protein